LNSKSIKALKAIQAVAAAATLLVAASVSHAQATPAAAASPAKKELIAKLLQVQQPGIENLSRAVLQGPLGNLMQGASAALQQLPPEKREAAAKSIEAEVKKFAEENAPMLRDRAIKLAPSTVGAMLEERFNEEELKQLLAWLESPVNKKFSQMGGEMQKALTEKLMADTGNTLDTRFKVLQQSVAKQLGIPAKPASATATPAPKK